MGALAGGEVGMSRDWEEGKSGEQDKVEGEGSHLA